MWFEGAQSFTIRAFHDRNTTLQKTLEINGNHHPRKRAFGRSGGVLRSLLPRSSLIHLLCGGRRWGRSRDMWRRDRFCLRFARLGYACGLR